MSTRRRVILVDYALHDVVNFLPKLEAVGADPYPYSSVYTPTLVFEAVQFAGV